MSQKFVMIMSCSFFMVMFVLFPCIGIKPLLVGVFHMSHIDFEKSSCQLLFK